MKKLLNKDKSLNLIEIVKKLDIPQTMRENAEKKYMKIAEDLSKVGIDVDIYPQGSFAIGTVVRPYTKGKDTEYDLDFICEEKLEKAKSNPEFVKKCIKEVLEQNGRNIQEDDTCWKAEYAEIQDNISFKMDIVPAVHEEDCEIQKLLNSGVQLRYAQNAIAITNRVNENCYEWGASNPKGYTEWFNDINRLFVERMKQSMDSNTRNSIEKIPVNNEKTPLQIIIQILKRHRDIYFYRVAPNIREKMSSAIITTLVAQVVESMEYVIEDTFELLKYVIEELKKYTLLAQENSSNFLTQYENKKLISKEKALWRIENPVNPENNLAASWTDLDAKAFFNWINNLEADLIISSEYDNEEYYAALRNSFGKDFIEKNVESFTFIKSSIKPVIVSEVKPYRRRK